MIETGLINLYIKSIAVFTVLKLNDTELSNLMTELFFFEGQRFRVAKVQRFFSKSVNFGGFES
jgi:hypothetical protein